MPKRLRSGYTTGACAAAAAKAAAMYIVSGHPPADVEIPFPDGSRVLFNVQWSEHISETIAQASIIKDAGDDPDVTNGAEIIACVEIGKAQGKNKQHTETITIRGGKGVGEVTKPGLAVGIGEPAINPVPRKMIRMAVAEALQEEITTREIIVTISVPKGEELAKKTLNKRLGIIGGISILGTTGIVRPVSADAWTATISASMSVAKAAGLREIMLSTGRTSERAVQGFLGLPDEAMAMMGDYLEFSLLEAASKGFERIHYAGMWAKIIKAAMEIPQTHVRHGALEVNNALKLLHQLGAEKNFLTDLADANTAREIYERLIAADRQDIIRKVCIKAREYAARVSGIKVTVYLVHASGRIVEHV
jgi:cobalt-precorrin-5B (C1)-methyltransferase